MKKIVIADCRAEDETIKSLEKLFETVIPTALLGCVYDSIASHADIQIHHLGEGRFVCAPEVYDHYKKHLPHEFTLIKGTKPIGAKYPYDIPYNAAPVGNSVICNARYTAEEILREYGENVIHTAQGYAKCSTCVVSENAVITADRSIAAACGRAGIDALLVREGNIFLKGMNYGFIGGASGLLQKGLLAFNGGIKGHPDCGIIRDFCKKHGTEITELKRGILTDIGSIIAVF